MKALINTRSRFLSGQNNQKNILNLKKSIAILCAIMGIIASGYKVIKSHVKSNQYYKSVKVELKLRTDLGKCFDTVCSYSEIKEYLKGLEGASDYGYFYMDENFKKTPITKLIVEYGIGYGKRIADSVFVLILKCEKSIRNFYDYKTQYFSKSSAELRAEEVMYTTCRNIGYLKIIAN